MTKTVARLISQFQPERYELELTPDAESLTFTGKVRITGRKVGRPSQRITFHQNGLKITKATVTHHDKKGGDTPVELDRINHHSRLLEVRLHSNRLLYPGSYTIDLEFSGTITQDMNGFYPCYFTHEGEKHTLLMTQFESHFARDLLPCIDEPEAKAIFELTLITPKDKTALANTPIKSESETNGLKVTTFEPTPKMSSYLLAFIIGDLHSKHTKTKNGVEVGVWGTIAQPADSLDFALDTAKRSVEFFEDYFGVPYPLPKIDHVAVPDFSAGAMENWGLVTYREAVLLLYPDQASQSTKEIISKVICHETSHMWFGDLVTMRWWDELWLNESFANMMEYVATDALFPDWRIWDTFYGDEAFSALRRDATPGVQAIKTDVHHPDEINTLFDPSIVYAKGSRLMYMLREYVGEDAFRTGLAAYFKKHAYGNTIGNDLWQALGEASGKDIGAFMDPWLDRAGFPVVTVDQTGSSLTLTQEHFSDPRAKAEQGRVWPVPTLAQRADIPELLSTSEQQVTLDDDSYVMLNHNGIGHYVVHYAQPDHIQALTAQVERGDITSETDRLVLLNDSSMLARAGYASFADSLRLLQAYHHESSESVWDIMSVILADAKRFIDIDEAIEEPIKELTRSMIADQYKRLGWEERDDEPAADKKLRATIIAHGTYAETPEIVERALELFKAYKSNPAVVSAELRSIVFGAAVRKEIPEAVDYLLGMHHQTTNSDLKRDICGALTSTKSANVARKLLCLLKNPDLIKPQDADRWLFLLMRNRHCRALAWDWMVNNWDWVLEVYGRDKSFDYFPRYAASVCSTPEWEKKFDDFFADKEHILVLRRNIAVGREEIAARVAWLQRDWPAVKKHFGL